MQDWIKMRTDLYRDPKVSVMADQLMQLGSELSRYVNQHTQRSMAVTRNVMRCATVGATLSVWGVMRHRGKRNGDDLICNGVTLAVIDDIADIPGFGEALEVCGWAVQTDEGIVFPRFFSEYNVQIDERGKTSAAERQARYRANLKAKSDGKRDVTRDVTVTRREEEIREEKNVVIETQEPQGTPKAAREYFRKPSVQDVAEYATGICASIDPQAFVDHYQSNGWRVGKATMKDWKAAVRNWAKRDLEGKAKNDSAVRAGFTAQARQDAQWAVFREFEEAAARDEERERQQRIASGGQGNGDEYRPNDHASLFS